MCPPVVGLPHARQLLPAMLQVLQCQVPGCQCCAEVVASCHSWLPCSLESPGVEGLAQPSCLLAQLQLHRVILLGTLLHQECLRKAFAQFWGLSGWLNPTSPFDRHCIYWVLLSRYSWSMDSCLLELKLLSTFSQHALGAGS